MAATQSRMILCGAQPTHDPLTGLLSGAEFERLLEQALSDGAFLAVAPLCVAYISLDRFRHINRWLGFAAGDEVLQVCAGRILGHRQARTAGNVILAARMGGDEFACVTSAASPEIA
ncbi:MAG TPA: diguanylate cyclase, partial [Bryobacteraceae bacterium]|nr:diguanylate cyclase [Bryobacteraceae bacterium]